MSKTLIEKTLIDMADNRECCLIITSGGTGPAERDVTPEATEAVCHKMMPGFGELMRAKSLTYVPTAILSRQTAGIRNRKFNCKFTREAKIYPTMFGCCLSGDSILH